MGWTTERPMEAGFYYFRANKFDLPNEPLRVLEYVSPYEGAPLEDHVGYTVAERLELQPDCEWLRIPSPDHLAALLRLAEAALAFIENFIECGGLNNSVETIEVYLRAAMKNETEAETK